LTNLENCLSNLLPLLCQINHNIIQQNDDETQRQLNRVLNIKLNDNRNIVLNQNVPNPFAEQTTISFSIPSTVNQAQIHFYDEKGNLIKTVELTERGNGKINVFASDLSTGTYTYTLVADGQVVATKRMVKID
jgi:flagellar hook assembly protein FlgD